MKTFCFKFFSVLCGFLMSSVSMSSAFAADTDIAIIFYSRSGNTEQLARFSSEFTGGDVFRIEPSPAYPDGYHATVDKVKEEMNAGILHGFKDINIDLSKYDTVILASPTWWGHIPSPLENWLKTVAVSFNGKKVVTFNSHGGSGVANTRADFEKVLPSAKFGTHLSVSGSPTKEQVENWLKENHII
ncbi:MAG TPA: hypothetical protein DCL74_07255 [Succinivibrionaceae bacterium]|mgnify:CR=1 FL=1|nr:hypothetical protein [Succinivibrionaceae bacterium]